MKRWQDWAAQAVYETPSPRKPLRSFLSAAIRFRVHDRDQATIEAQVNDVPFTPIWWWWNADADEYVMTLWDTEAGSAPAPTYFVGGRGITVINPEKAVK